MMGWALAGLMTLSAYGMVFMYDKGGDDRENQMMAHMYLSQSEIERHRREMEDAVVKAIKGVRIENKTYVQRFKEVETQSVVYRECKHSDDALGLLNSALRGDPVPAKPAVQSQLPN